MASKTVKVEIKVDENDSTRLKDKVKVLENFSKANVDDQKRLLEIMGSQKHLKALADNWETLKAFV